MSRRIVLSGGPGAGKTTILDVLAQAGFRVATDVARDIIRERRAGGLSPRPSPEVFNSESMKRNQAAFELAGDHDLTLFERGVCESVASQSIRGVITRSEADRMMSRFRYDEPILVTPPWEAIYTTDDERDQTYEHAVRVCEIIVDWYRQFDYVIVEVPIGPIESRVDFVRRQIEVPV